MPYQERAATVPHIQLVLHHDLQVEYIPSWPHTKLHKAPFTRAILPFALARFRRREPAMRAWKEARALNRPECLLRSSVRSCSSVRCREQLLALCSLPLGRLRTIVPWPLTRAVVALALAIALCGLVVVELRPRQTANSSVAAGERGTRVQTTTQDHSAMTLLLDVEAFAVAWPLVACHLPEP